MLAHIDKKMQNYMCLALGWTQITGLQDPVWPRVGLGALPTREYLGPFQNTPGVLALCLGAAEPVEVREVDVDHVALLRVQQTLHDHSPHFLLTGVNVQPEIRKKSSNEKNWQNRIDQEPKCTNFDILKICSAKKA